MTLYRHFASKDVRQSAKTSEACWDRFEKALAQLREWLKEMVAHVASTDERGCPLANAAVELPEKGHPARRVIEEAKAAHRLRLVHLCSAAGLSEPDMLADELDLLLEGARVSAQSVGSNGLGARLIRMGEAMIASHSSR
jgi:AcrR family transcriptional regulator